MEERKIKRMLYAHRSKNLFVVFIRETSKLVEVQNCGITLLIGKKEFHKLFKKEKEVYSFI